VCTEVADVLLGPLIHKAYPASALWIKALCNRPQGLQVLRQSFLVVFTSFEPFFCCCRK
jgi:hypothetical protein